MSILLENKKAYFDYEVLEIFEAGLALRGWEVKSIKNKQGSLSGGRVIMRGEEAFLVGLNIPPYQANNLPGDFEPQRTIKLLITKKEIKYLEGKAQEKGLTIIPLKLYTRARKIKLAFGLCRGKKKFEKREKIKKRETAREIERFFKRG
jgi:SsrA-binding protein